MEKKQAITASNPSGMCEKLFNALQPTLRPLRRLTFRQQEPPSTTTAISSPPPSEPPKVQNSEPRPVKAQDQKILPSPPPPPPKTEVQNPKKATTTTEKPKKGVNEKVDDIINHTKAKVRTAAGAGRVSSSK